MIKEVQVFNNNSIYVYFLSCIVIFSYQHFSKKQKISLIYATTIAMEIISQYSCTANEVELTSSLERLSKMLASHYDKAPVIIIDEYDTPIQEGYSKDFYDEIIGFMRNFFSGAFKDNKNLSYGFLTGILRIAQESIFSGLNNLTVNSVMDEEYDSFFGFTESEVKAMLSYYGVSDKEEELKDWYDGYLFGSEEIYNPWSVINYISKGCLPQAYWVNTGKNEILDDVLRVATDDITERLYDLLQTQRF